MALSNLTSFGTQVDGALYNVFDPKIIGRLSEGTELGDMWFGMVGVSKSNQNVVYFAVGTDPFSHPSLTLNDDSSAILATNNTDASNNQPESNIYSVNVGTNASSAFSLTIKGTGKDKKTGKWVFVKGSTDPRPKKKDGTKNF